MMKRLSYTMLPMHPYSPAVVVAFGGTCKSAIKLFSRLEKVPEPSEARMDELGKGISGRMVTNPHNDDVLLWMPEYPKSPETMGTFAHELSHVVFHVMARSGIVLVEDEDNYGTFIHDEPFTYLMGYLMSELLTRIKFKHVWFKSDNKEYEWYLSPLEPKLKSSK